MVRAGNGRTQISTRGVQNPDEPSGPRTDERLYDHLYCLRGDRVEAVWPIAARGMSQ